MTIVSVLPGCMNTQSNLNGETTTGEHQPSEQTPILLDGVAMRWATIARLREQIAAGTYHVSSLEVASRMIDAMMR